MTMSWHSQTDQNIIENTLNDVKCTKEEILSNFKKDFTDLFQLVGKILLKAYTKKHKSDLDIATSLYFLENMADYIGGYGGELLRRLNRLKQDMDELLKVDYKSVDLEKVRDYVLSQSQNEPLSLIVLLAATRSTVSMMLFCDEEQGIMILSLGEIKHLFEKYMKDFLSGDGNKKLKTEENAIITTLITDYTINTDKIIKDIIKLFLPNMNNITQSFLRLLSSDNMQAKLMGWVALGEILGGTSARHTEPSAVDTLRGEAKKLLPHLFALIQGTKNENLVGVLEMLMNRNEENVREFFNTLLKLDEVPEKYLEFISSLLCTDEYDVRLEVYTGIQELYNKGLLDNKNLDFIYNKLLEKCSKGAAKQQ